MKNIPKWLVVLNLMLTLLFSHHAFAQMTEAERNTLLQLAEQYKRQYAVERNAVEAFAKEHNLPLEVRNRKGQIIAVLDHLVNGQPVYVGPDNIVSQASVSADRIKTGGGLGLNLSGAGQVLGIWEAGGTVRATHQEFGGRVTNLDATAATDHATHVAGTMIAAGVDPDAQGFAHAATLRSYDSGGDNGEMAAEAAAATPIRVSNHSYSPFSGWYFDNGVMPAVWRWFGNAGDASDWQFGAYTADAQAWDNIAANAPFYLIVKSAGNDRDDNGPAAGTTYNLGFTALTSMAFRNPDGGAAGFDCVSAESNAKNILTVGAAFPVAGGNGYTGPNNVAITGFSGWGPTDDGRVKPDVVADGADLYSSVATADNDYDNFWGTSMSSPSTAGAIGLLLEHWAGVLTGVPRASTMKALLINEADEVGPNNGPDYSFGWGHVNAADAAEIINFHDYEGCDHIVEASVAAGATFSYSINSSGAQPLKISLVWTDPASLVINAGTLNPAGANYLVNDLNLRLDDGVTTFFPWVLDPANPANAAGTGNNTRDNVEQILVLNPSAGSYTIRVVAPAALTAGPQQFSLVMSGNDATADNATYSFLMISDRQTYAVRKVLTFGPDFTVKNTGRVEAYAGERIRLTPGFRAEPGSRFRARILPGGGCGIFSGDLKADNYPGSKPAADSRQAGKESDAPDDNHAAGASFEISPNPAVDAFTVRFHAAETDTRVHLWVVNAQGQTVQTLLSNATYAKGEFVETFRTHALPPGNYFCVLQNGKQRSVRPLVILTD